MGHYIYLMQLGDTSTYKIGRSLDPKTRRAAIRRTLSQPVQIVDTADVYSDGNAYRIEKRLHERYSAQRVENEWFELTPDDVSDIRFMFELINQCQISKIGKVADQRQRDQHELEDWRELGNWAVRRYGDEPLWRQVVRGDRPVSAQIMRYLDEVRQRLVDTTNDKLTLRAQFTRAFNHNGHRED